VLDRGGHAPGTGAEEALRDMATAARVADDCGYHRLWVAEHHASPRTASCFPAVLIAHLAAQTHRIRVGSGGVMLPNHPPFSVAEQFATLQALHPGRIDLGLGRSSGVTVTTEKLLEAALRRDPQAFARFPEQIDELLGFLEHRGPDRHRFHELSVSPHTATPPQVHLLGAGEGSARLAAERGLPFAYGHHLGRSKVRPEAVARYRDGFAPADDGATPHVIVSVNVICAETDDEAEELARQTAAYRVDYPGDPQPSARLSAARRDYLTTKALAELGVVRGGPDRVRAELTSLAEDLGADEIMLVPYELTGAARSRTLRLVRQADRPPVAAGLPGQEMRSV
jgi:luciferase family oxidoreductase group 1